MKTAKILIIGILFGISGFLIGIGLNFASTDFEQTDHTSFDDNKSNTVSVMFDTGDELLGFSSVEIEESQTVYSVLKFLDSRNESVEINFTEYDDMGVLINSINKKENGDSNRYWQYWVNNSYADVSVDAYILSPGDVIFWKFTSSRFQEF